MAEESKVQALTAGNFLATGSAQYSGDWHHPIDAPRRDAFNGMSTSSENTSEYIGIRA